MKNKNLIIVGMFLLIGNIGIVSATNSLIGSFDLFGLFAENIFGNILLSGIGIAAMIIFIAMISKMSRELLIFILLTYTLSFGSGYVGAIIAVPIFIFTFIYFSLAIWGFINRGR